jgi:hypothetical protein
VPLYPGLTIGLYFPLYLTFSHRGEKGLTVVLSSLALDVHFTLTVKVFRLSTSIKARVRVRVKFSPLYLAFSHTGEKELTVVLSSLALDGRGPGRG